MSEATVHGWEIRAGQVVTDTEYRHDDRTSTLTFSDEALTTDEVAMVLRLADCGMEHGAVHFAEQHSAESAMAKLRAVFRIKPGQ